MRLVSEQSDAEIAKRHALRQVATHLRALAANLIRTSRGAGSPHYLDEQMVACLNAMAAYRSAAGHGVSTFEFQAMLDPREVRESYRPTFDGTPEDWARWEADGSFDRAQAVEDIRRAALQMTASMLVDQAMHVSRAENDLYDSTRRLEAAREKRRAYREAERKAALKPQRRPAGKPSRP